MTRQRGLFGYDLKLPSATIRECLPEFTSINELSLPARAYCVFLVNVGLPTTPKCVKHVPIVQAAVSHDRKPVMNHLLSGQNVSPDHVGE